MHFIANFDRVALLSGPLLRRTEAFDPVSLLADVSEAVLRVFGSLDALVVETCVLCGSGSLTHHLAAMHEVLHTVSVREGADQFLRQQRAVLEDRNLKPCGFGEVFMLGASTHHVIGPSDRKRLSLEGCIHCLHAVTGSAQRVSRMISRESKNTV